MPHLGVGALAAIAAATMAGGTLAKGAAGAIAQNSADNKAEDQFNKSQVGASDYRSGGPMEGRSGQVSDMLARAMTMKEQNQNSLYPGGKSFKFPRY
jgi:hypothetical protein